MRQRFCSFIRTRAGPTSNILMNVLPSYRCCKFDIEVGNLYKILDQFFFHVIHEHPSQRVNIYTNTTQVICIRF